jgi:hypothetical protein
MFSDFRRAASPSFIYDAGPIKKYPGEFSYPSLFYEDASNTSFDSQFNSTQLRGYIEARRSEWRKSALNGD